MQNIKTPDKKQYTISPISPAALKNSAGLEY